MTGRQKIILIVGASGFIGKKLLTVGDGRTDVELCGTGFRSKDKDLIALDVRDPESAAKVIQSIQPDVIIYASGVANVNLAETARDLTGQLNADAVRNIADCFQGYFIYLSTHYVFDGLNPPYSIDAERNPVNYYGQSKVRGEDLTKELFPKHAIIRLDTLYGYNDAQDRRTFVTEVIHALSLNKPIYLDNEMGRSPVLTDDAVAFIYAVIDEEHQGIFQLAEETSITKYEWAKLVANVFGYDESLVRSLQEHPDQAQLGPRRPLDPRMISSRKISSVQSGLEQMRAQMVREVEQRFEDDMEYFDVDGKYLGRKSRADIHRNGNWHMAVQTFIARRGEHDQLQILSQHRRVVDIAKQKWDHTAAVQMLPDDKRDPLKGIMRGLEMELGITEKDVRQMHLVSDGILMRSSRKYGDEPHDLYNREFVFVTVAELEDGAIIRPDPIKIEKIQWMDWDTLVRAVLVDAAGYTKNLRHNFVNTFLAAHIKNYACRMLGIEGANLARENKLIGSAYYSPPDNQDLVLSVFAAGEAVIEHLTTDGETRRAPVSEDPDVISDLLHQPNLLPRYVYEYGIFDIDPAMIPSENVT